MRKTGVAVRSAVGRRTTRPKEGRTHRWRFLSLGVVIFEQAPDPIRFENPFLLGTRSMTNLPPMRFRRKMIALAIFSLSTVSSFRVVDYPAPRALLTDRNLINFCRDPVDAVCSAGQDKRIEREKAYEIEIKMIRKAVSQKVYPETEKPLFGLQTAAERAAYLEYVKTAFDEVNQRVGDSHARAVSVRDTLKNAIPQEDRKAVAQRVRFYHQSKGYRGGL